MFHNRGDSWDPVHHRQQSGWQDRSGSQSHDVLWKQQQWRGSQEESSTGSWKQQQWHSGKWEQRRRSRSRSWHRPWGKDRLEEKDSEHGAVSGGVVLRPRANGATLKPQIANGVELVSRERPEDCVFQVSGAGGKGSIANGQYKHSGSMEGKPMYKQIGGEGILYCFELWKITPKGDTTGWFYAAPSGGNGPEPPSGMWTTDGYNGGSADPPPIITKLDRVSAAVANGGRRAVRLGPAKRLAKSVEAAHHKAGREGLKSSIGAGDGGEVRDVVDLMSSPSRSPRPARVSPRSSPRPTSLLGGDEAIAALKAKLSAMKARKKQPEIQVDEMSRSSRSPSASPVSVPITSGPPGVWDGPPLPEAAAGPPVPVAPPWAGIGPGSMPPHRPFKPSRMKGWVTQFWPERQSGYLSSDFIQFGTELYFDVHGPLQRTLQVGDAVDFSAGRSPFGDHIAVNVTSDSRGAGAHNGGGGGVASPPGRSESPSSLVDTSAFT